MKSGAIIAFFMSEKKTAPFRVQTVVNNCPFLSILKTSANQTTHFSVWWHIVFLMLIILFSFRVNAVRINEVELNPPGEDSGNEWIELYSAQETVVDGWRIENVKGKNVILNGSFSEYNVILTPYNFLANNKQKLILFDERHGIVDETEVISDANNDERSWQYCSKWVFQSASKGQENECYADVVKENKSNVIKIEEPVKKEILNEPDKTINSNVINTNLQAQETISEPIRLVPKDIKTWNSQENRIKEYVLYGFTLFCIVLLITLIRWRKYGPNKNSDDF